MARKTKTGQDASIVNGYFCYSESEQFPMTSELFADEIDNPSLKAIRVVSMSSSWINYVWVGSQQMIEDICMEMTLRKETRSGKSYWYAYRRFGGKLYKRFVGTSDRITPTLLIEIARKLPAKSNLRKAE